MFITAARFPLESYRQNEAVRQRADEVLSHLENLALDNGLDPVENIHTAEIENEFRVGVSEEFDMFLREATGTWRHM